MTTMNQILSREKSSRLFNSRNLLTLESTEIDLNVFFLLWATTLVFIMQGGFMLLEVGSVSIRNTKNILFKNAFDVCISACCFYLWGYAFAYGDDSSGGFIGTTEFALSDMEKRRSSGENSFAGSISQGHLRADAAFFYAHFAFALSFAATAATIMSGAVAERMNFKAYIPLTVLTVSVIYPMVAHWVWSSKGWMSAFKVDAGSRLFGVGVVDFAGSLVVHVVGGTAAVLVHRAEIGTVRDWREDKRVADAIAGVSNVWDNFNVVRVVRV
jgi:ammonium transporter, Amt family